jgi:hypothetical protein
VNLHVVATVVGRDPWPHGEGWVVDVVEGRPGEGRPGEGRVTAVLSKPVADEDDGRAAATDVGAADAWLVDRRSQWDGLGDGDGTWPVPGFKQMSFLRRVAPLDHDGFVAAWERHSGLARRHHPALWRYTQNMVVGPLLPETPDIDGIAELTMRLRQDFVDRMYDSAEGQRIIAEDVRGFIDLPAGWRLRTREYRR